MVKYLPLPDSAHIPVPTPGFTLEELDDELLLFRPQDGRLLELNSTAALVWQLCDGTRSTAEISDLLSTAFPEAGAVVKSDVPQILSTLAKLGAVSWVK